jgi:hypothetical protein
MQFVRVALANTNTAPPGAPDDEQLVKVQFARVVLGPANIAPPGAADDEQLVKVLSVIVVALPDKNNAPPGAPSAPDDEQLVKVQFVRVVLVPASIAPPGASNDEQLVKVLSVIRRCRMGIQRGTPYAPAATAPPPAYAEQCTKVQFWIVNSLPPSHVNIEPPFPSAEVLKNVVLMACRMVLPCIPIAPPCGSPIQLSKAQFFTVSVPSMV